jgi:hypothetical protein
VKQDVTAAYLGWCSIGSLLFLIALHSGRE